MERQWKIAIMVLITLTIGQAKEDLDIIKEMMEEMKMELKVEVNERLSLAEGKLAKTKAELAAIKDDLEVTQDELAVTKDDLAVTKDELAATKDDLAVSKDELAVTKDALAKAVLDLAEAHAITKDDLAILKASPYIHACGAHYEGLSASYGTIPYTSLLYSSTNQEDGGLDIATGVFTAPLGGSYSVSWDTNASLDHGEDVHIFLQKNGERIPESHHNSYYGGDDHVNEQGGRTMVLYLGMGDTLQLFRSDVNQEGGYIFNTIFCVSLNTFDIV